MLELDVGVVVYRRAPRGGLTAVWYSSTLESGRQGTGIAVGGAADTFAGDYQVSYFLADRTPVGSFDLKIEAFGEVFQLSWKAAGAVVFAGVGIETADGLVAGWRKAT